MGGFFHLCLDIPGSRVGGGFRLKRPLRGRTVAEYGMSDGGLRRWKGGRLPIGPIRYARGYRPSVFPGDGESGVQDGDSILVAVGDQLIGGIQLDAVSVQSSAAELAELAGVDPRSKIQEWNAVFSRRKLERNGTLSGQLTECYTVLRQSDGQQAVAPGINGFQLGVAAEVQSGDLVVRAVQICEVGLIGQIQGLDPGVVPQQGVQGLVVRQVRMREVSPRTWRVWRLGFPLRSSS